MTYLERISKVNKKIMATAQFATKANFLSASKPELTDISAFFQQYLENVSTEFLASELDVNIINNCSSSFEILAKKIELSIVVDNIVHNSVKAHANSLKVKINPLSENRLSIIFSDNGRGIDNNIDKEKLFDIGVTDTTGSGLGLYQTKEILDSLDASINFVECDQGASLELVFVK